MAAEAETLLLLKMIRPEEGPPGRYLHRGRLGAARGEQNHFRDFYRIEMFCGQGGALFGE
jgi:hypothetical protein